MACFTPNYGHYQRYVTEDGEVISGLQFMGALRKDQPPSNQDEQSKFVTLPCGTCNGCLLERSRQWAVRCMHEADCYESNCMITLTYDEDHLPWGGSLDKSHFQKFMKRLRKKYGTIRYFHCGEYGETYGRPHYHGLLFGFDFPDKYVRSQRRGLPIFGSPSLEQLWPYGLSEIGSVTFESAAYVARYILKKQVHPSSNPLEIREPEYLTMSRRPGIGRPWLDKYHTEVYPRDSVIVRGFPSKPPRFYDKAFEIAPDAESAEIWAKIKAQRETRRRLENETLARRHAGQVILEAKTNLYRRDLNEAQGLRSS